MAEAIEREEAGRAPPLKLSRILRARRETVFRAWSSAEHIKRWFAPEGCVVVEAMVEMRLGGRFVLGMRAPNGEVNWLHGTFVEIVPDARLVIDMRIDDSAGSPLFRAYTEVGFADAPDGTRLDVTQTYTLIDLSKAWMLAGAPQGWNSTLDNLEREAARMQGA
ncbi:MAG: SRPBCC domain-containing protein [Stellaceae bacterium]